MHAIFSFSNNDFLQDINENNVRLCLCVHLHCLPKVGGESCSAEEEEQNVQFLCWGFGTKGAEIIFL